MRPVFESRPVAGMVFLALVFLCWPMPVTAQVIVVSHLAGPLAGTLGSADGTGTDARFNSPFGVATDASGNVWVADTDNSTIRRITPAGVVTTVAGLAGSTGSDDGTGTAARFNYPYGIAVDASGQVFVADNGNRTIRRISSSGVVTTLAGRVGVAGSEDGAGTAATFGSVLGVAVDGTGTVYVVDSSNHTIRSITASGVVSTLAGLAGASGSADGTGSEARFYFPYGVAVDAVGTVYVTDRGNRTIRRITPAGEVTTVAGSVGQVGSADGTGSAARFAEPRGIAVDAVGVIYVADPGNQTIRRVTPAARVTTIAGTAGIYGHQDGVGADARFLDPDGVALSPLGRLMVADRNNNVIRQAWRQIRRRDFDADGKTDLAVYRSSSGSWFSMDSSTDNASYQTRGWGVEAQGDTAAPGDYDGDGIVDPTVYRPATGTWFVLQSSAGFADWTWFGWGNPTDTLVQGDYDGDGATDAAVYRPSTGAWYVRPSSGASPWSVVFGAGDDIPVPGDYDGDGKMDVAVYRSASGTWFILGSASRFTAWEYYGWGLQAHNDTPVPGDYDGDGVTDICVYRPASGTWFVLTSSSGRTAYTDAGWGSATDLPMPGDYDGDGRTDQAVYRPSTGIWYVKPSSGATQWSRVFGSAGDTPLQGIR